MNAFSQKLKIIYVQLANENINDFTEMLIDYSKYDKNKFIMDSDRESKEQFFSNRKTVLRRWLNQGTNCTPDFQKSFYNYKLSKLHIKGNPLFKLSDFIKEDNLEYFDQQIEKYLKYQRRVQITVDYKYIYSFSTLTQTINYYEIVEWEKDSKGETTLLLEKNSQSFRAKFQLLDNNIFITLQKNDSQLYMLFYDNQDNSSTYITGMSMGYLEYDNKVPMSKKVIFSKELLQNKELEFMLNETETLSAIENRFSTNLELFQVNHFMKYVNKLKNYSKFFKRLRKTSYKELFYYRLAFSEFYAIKKLFKRVSKKESYYIIDFQRAFLELIKTVESIGNIKLQVVMQLTEESPFLKSSYRDLEIRSRFLNLYQNYKIEPTIIFVIDSDKELSTKTKYLFSEMIEQNIEVRTIIKEEIVHDVDSLNFSFIHLHDNRDFVLADPVRDSKNVYKIYTNELTMDEYRTDYESFINKSKVYNTED